MAKVWQGKPVADLILAGCKSDLAALDQEVGLAIVLVGQDPASAIYVGRKRAKCKELGIKSVLIELPDSATTDQIIAEVDRLNADPGIHGILVQQPLPRQVATDKVVSAIDPAKDVDGLHPTNVGLLAVGNESGLVACTPRGCMFLLEQMGVEVAGKQAVVVGRSMIVGRPLSLLLDQAGATVTVCHSATKDLASCCRQADILAVAAGKPRLITADMVKPGAAVLDVGINRLDDDSLAGDVDIGAVSEVAAHITPVPGGIGPLTVAMLMANTITAAHRAKVQSQS